MRRPSINHPPSRLPGVWAQLMRMHGGASLDIIPVHCYYGYVLLLTRQHGHTAMTNSVFLGVRSLRVSPSLPHLSYPLPSIFYTTIRQHGHMAITIASSLEKGESFAQVCPSLYHYSFLFPPPPPPPPPLCLLACNWLTRLHFYDHWIFFGEQRIPCLALAPTLYRNPHPTPFAFCKAGAVLVTLQIIFYLSTSNEAQLQWLIINEY